MGQPVAVTPLPSSQPGLLRFEANRSLTGMGHEHYRTVDDATGSGSGPILARRLLETGEVEAVHVYSNIITVDLRKGFTGESLEPIIEDLYTYYRPGFVPPPLEMPAEEAPAGRAGTGVGRRRPADRGRRGRFACARGPSRAQPAGQGALARQAGLTGAANPHGRLALRSGAPVRPLRSGRSGPSWPGL